MEGRKSITLTWDGLRDDDEEEYFFETRERMSSAFPLDLEASSSDEEDDFEDSRVSFSSAVTTITPVPSVKFKTQLIDFAAGTNGADYDMWMEAPASITERRKRLLLGMGLDENKELLRATSMALDRAISKKFETGNIICSPPTPSTNPPCPCPCPSTSSSSSSTINAESEKKQYKKTRRASVIPFVLGRSKSESDIDSFSMPNNRKKEFLGKQHRLKRASSDTTFSRGGARTSAHQKETIRSATATSTAIAKPKESDKPPRAPRHGSKLSSVKSNSGTGAFFLIKNLDTGKEFVVNGCDEDGMWNKLSDLQTGKNITIEEFEKHVGHSSVVKELMTREKVTRSGSNGFGLERKLHSQHSYFSKSLRKSKKTGAALLKNIKGVASGFIGEREREESQTSYSDQKPSKNDGWVKVRQSGKSQKELSALHLCQEFQAHEGCVWTMRFSFDGRFMASAGEDRVIHVWEVQESEVMSLKPEDGNVTPIHPSLLGKEDGHEKKKKGKLMGSKKGWNSAIPDYVQVPESVFSLSEKPYCSFHGHSDDVLDLSWSKSQLLLSSSMDKTVRLWDMETKACLKLFTHNDYVTCIQFNPLDDDYFISGSLDAKVRIWNIPERYVVDWVDVHEMVTAISYAPDSQAAYVGTHKGSCRIYSIVDSKLNQLGAVELRRKKKSHLRKVTGFQFTPDNPSEVLVTSADSRTRIVEGSKVIHKFIGFRNANSQIAASFSPDGKYVISASEDSQVFVWKNEGHGKGRSLVVTYSHETFPCKDVSVAIPWPRFVKCVCDPLPPNPNPNHPPSKSPSRRLLASASTRGSHSLAIFDPTTDHKKTPLPPLPTKKNHHHASPDDDVVPPISRTRSSFHSFGSASGKGGSRRWTPPFFRRHSHDHDHGNDDDPSSLSAGYNGIGDHSFSSSSSSSSTSSPRSASTRYSDSSHSMSTFDNGSGNQTLPNTAWGLVIVTAGYDGEIRCYQNFGLPRKI